MKDWLSFITIYIERMAFLTIDSHGLCFTNFSRRLQASAAKAMSSSTASTASATACAAARAASPERERSCQGGVCGGICSEKGARIKIENFKIC